MRVIALASVSVATLMVAACGPDEPESPGPPKVGTQITYNNGRKVLVVRVDRELVKLKHSYANNPAGSFSTYRKVFFPIWSRRNGRALIYRYASDPWAKIWPLKIGNHAKSKVTSTIDGRPWIKSTLFIKVIGRQKLELPIGRVDTFVIEMIWSSAPIAGIERRVRRAKLWFAPKYALSLKHWYVDEVFRGNQVYSRRLRSVHAVKVDE